MRVLSRIGVSLAIAAFATAANADLIIDSQTLPIEDISSYQVQVDSQGKYTIIIETNDGWTLEPSGVIPDPDPITVTFNANPTTVTEGGSVTFSWTSTNAEACTASGGNTEWAGLGSVGLSGSRALVMNELNPAPFRLTCTAAGLTSVSRTVGVTVNPIITDGGPNDCPAPEVSGSTVSWESFWGGNIFPNQDVVQKDERIGRSENLAIEFNTANFNGLGYIKTIQFSDGNRNVAISECPGVFIENVPSSCFQRQANGQTLYWSTDGSRGCMLDKNKTYYVNITYVDVANESSASTFCESSSCRFYINAASAAR